MGHFKFDGFHAKEIGSIVCCTISLILWFSLFFPLLFPQIRINNEYLDADCTILSVKKEAYRCCTKQCSYCSMCGAQPSCSGMLAALVEGGCCDGYKCCSTCCDTCRRCSKGSCSSYSCNCRCCLSTPDQACNIVCNTCWRVRVQISYTCSSTGTCCEAEQKTQKVKDCGRDEGCADAYMQKPYLVENTTNTCFYDPTRCNEVEFEKGYTWWYWFLWAFPTFAILVLLNFWTFAGINTWLDDVKKALIGYLAIWWVIIFPLVFLLPIAVGTRTDQVDPTSKNVILALAFILMASALGAIGYLYYLIRGTQSLTKSGDVYNVM